MRKARKRNNPLKFEGNLTLRRGRNAIIWLTLTNVHIVSKLVYTNNCEPDTPSIVPIPTP